MQSNPYTPPKAELRELARRPGSPLKAVLLGLTIDVGGSMILGVVLGIAYAASLASSGVGAPQINEALGDISPTSWVSIVGTALGGVLSVLAGFTCARVARREDYKLGFILGAISALSGLLLSGSTYSVPMNVLLCALTFGAVLLGTRLGIRK
jgi:hypothetical protein